MKKFTIFFAILLCVTLTGCTRSVPVQSSGPMGEPSGSVSAPPAEEASEPASPPVLPAEPAPVENGQVAALYIGTRSSGFTEYPMPYEGELTPEKLIQGIADLTGWDLTLAGPVISGKGGMSVCLSEGSSLFTDPPDPQKEEFHMYDGYQFAETILDSIQRTLQKAFVLEPGDPDALDIWYFLEGEKPLEIPALGLSWPMDQPYSWNGGETD